MGDTNLKTITFDPSVYKLVPVEPTGEMLKEVRKVIECNYNSANYKMYYKERHAHKHMLAAVPDQLPGVVEHSGEPVGEIICNFPQGWHMQALVSWNQIGQGTKLYTHPAPSQPQMTFEEAWDGIDWDVWRMRPIRELVQHLHSLTPPSQPSAEAIVAKALEAALNIAVKVCDDIYPHIHNFDAKCSDAIRALSAQQIIEEASK